MLQPAVIPLSSSTLASLLSLLELLRKLTSLRPAKCAEVGFEPGLSVKSHQPFGFGEDFRFDDLVSLPVLAASNGTRVVLRTLVIRKVLTIGDKNTSDNDVKRPTNANKIIVRLRTFHRFLTYANLEGAR